MDCEGDILQRVREIVGPATPVGAVLDPHAHLTLAMVEAADILVFMKEYPHTDGHERSEELLRVLLAMLNGSVAPTPAVFDCQWIGIFPTNTEPMRGFVDRLFERERAPGVLSISFVHGFPWGDTPHTGAKVLVYTNRSPDLAADVARRVHSDLWSLRDRLGLPLTSIDDMLHQLREPRTAPLLIADVADNPGGGAPADSTFVLRALRSAGVRNAVLGLLIDPEAVRMCHQVGVGGHVCLRVGGKVSRFSGDPVDLEAEVCGLARSAVMDVLGLAEFAMGDTAWIHADGIDVALGSIRVQTYAPSAFTHLGIDLAGKTAIAVKSSTHFAAAFNAVSRDVVHVASPGALDFDVAALPFRVFDRHFHPRDKITFEPQE
jgi:microcystin degradation protein MlrC